jgi:hypothetical protein
VSNEKILAILAWGFTLAAVCLSIYCGVTGKGGILCAVLMTMALAAQCVYGKAIKRKQKEQYKPQDDDDPKDQKKDSFWDRRYYGK